MSNLIQRKSRHHGSSLKKDENNISTLLKTKRKGLKYPRYSKTESSKWKTNNLQLARENARLKKELQKRIAAVNECAIRYENLEVAWRRRGETLSKIDIISRLVGNQISKLVDTLTELRTACQVELSIPLHEALTEPLDQISYLRHSMPVRSDKSAHQMNSRSQLVNHVNPMVSGHPIIKPTITLQRLNLRNVPSNVPGEQIQVQSQLLNEVEIQVQSQLLNEVEIPLERLSLAQIAERIGSPVGRSMSRLEAQGDRSIFASPEMSSHIPLDSILEETSETFSPRNNSSARESPRHLVHSPNSHWPEVSFDERSSVPNRHSNNSARKYSATSRVKTPTSAEQRNRINADVEKCCLVVALKDVGSYLHNGTLTNVELLEERKVKTGASAHSDVKLGDSNENDGPHFNISAASGEDQIEVNFTAEIQTMDYGDIPATQEFFNRIRNEDPLEGPSWRYENVTTREVKKRHRSQCLNFSPSAKKNKQNNVSPSINKPKKNNILDSSVLFEPIDKHLKLESENLFNNDDTDTTEMEFAKCTIIPCEANTSITEEEEKKLNISDVSIQHEDCLESSPGISSCATNNEVNLSLNKIEYNSELESNCKPDKSKSYKNIGQNRMNSCKQKNMQKEKCVSKSHSKEEKEKKKSGKCSVKINKKDIKTVPETLVEKIVETRRSGSMYEEHSRTRRKVAPKCLKEPMLRNKLRRE